MADLFDLAVIEPFHTATVPATRRGKQLAQPRRPIYSAQQARFLHALERLRWGDHPRCVRCGGGRIADRPMGRHIGYLRCLDCKHLFTARSGTLLAKSTLDTPRLFVLITIALRPTGDPPIGARRAARLTGMNEDTVTRIFRRIRRATGDDALLLNAIADACTIHIDDAAAPDTPAEPYQISLKATLAA